MRELFLSVLVVLSMVLSGCDGQDANTRQAAAPPPNQGGLSLQPLSMGGGAPAAEQYGTAPAPNIPAPVGGNTYQSDPFSQTGQPYAVQSGQPAPARTRYSSPYDALFQGPYGSGGYARPAYATATAQPMTTSYLGSPAVTYAAPAAGTAAVLPGTITYSSAPGQFSADPVPVLSPATSALTGETGGLRLIPALDIPPGNHPGDVAPSQWFEIVRPGNGPLRIGRVSTTCVCVGVRAPKRLIAAGERALIEARTLKRPPRNNLVYGIFVSVLEPQKTMLDVDVTIRY